MQGSSGDADIENRLVDTEWEGEGGMNRESSMETHTLPYVKCKIANGHSLYHSGAESGAWQQPSGMGWVGSWKGGSSGRGHMYVYG